MPAAILWFVLGLVLLALGGDSVVKGASGLARRFGASPFVAGLVLVAFGTSLPELAVNLRAMLEGQPGLALGNAVGSNIVNFGLTLGAAALAAPLLVRWRALSPLLLLLLLGTLAVIGLGLDGSLGRIDGLLLLVAFVAVLAFAIARTRREAPELQDAIAAYAQTRTGLDLNLIRLAIAAVLMYFGAVLVIRHGLVLGSAMGLTPLLTGLLPVAIATALPEMAAAVVAARRGQGEMVAGHVIGSSLFNLFVIVGGMALWRPVPIPVSFIRFELPAALLIALMLVPMLRGDLRLSRGEGGVLVAAFAGWVALELLFLNS
ncbi:sodium:calcium antiporter [Marilutibacter alkalisoli]|uniref:Sodium:calcium antiporter n=1 Tax=Marilutibacter alkalisoli TaxID=2591633 RepID=A0A514BUU5_9GAMM|nr:sodium:calcium antiporter [Lysobacter alkalisoli]QDH71085.1 sodium:calcium antiporter [Lysobacter alkalisoli]